MGALLAVADFKIDGAALTGGIAHSKYVTKELSAVLSPCAPVRIYPGSFEMEALIERTLGALEGEVVRLHYPSGRAL